ncbi:hypothetical protein D1BOALGB6SA_7585 [Olavius sp. associated proteobacterium Delta 1]|nr:hypothetical protein D1BOALGB6SA_7585 [Olavius sp. associated proteobacterium Delta 1]
MRVNLIISKFCEVKIRNFSNYIHETYLAKHTDIDNYL